MNIFFHGLGAVYLAGSRSNREENAGVVVCRGPRRVVIRLLPVTARGPTKRSGLCCYDKLFFVVTYSLRCLEGAHG